MKKRAHLYVTMLTSGICLSACGSSEGQKERGAFDYAGGGVIPAHFRNTASGAGEVKESLKGSTLASSALRLAPPTESGTESNQTQNSTLTQLLGAQVERILAPQVTLESAISQPGLSHGHSRPEARRIPFTGFGETLSGDVAPWGEEPEKADCSALFAEIDGAVSQAYTGLSGVLELIETAGQDGVDPNFITRESPAKDEAFRVSFDLGEYLKTVPTGEDAGDSVSGDARDALKARVTLSGGANENEAIFRAQGSASVTAQSGTGDYDGLKDGKASVEAYVNNSADKPLFRLAAVASGTDTESNRFQAGVRLGLAGGSLPSMEISARADFSVEGENQALRAQAKLQKLDQNSAQLSAGLMVSARGKTESINLAATLASDDFGNCTVKKLSCTGSQDLCAGVRSGL